MQAEDLVQLELTFNRFRRLIGELQARAINRNHFEPWEIEILLDLETCQVNPRRWTETLRQYEKAVERQFERGADTPMKLSEYLTQRSTQRVANL